MYCKNAPITRGMVTAVKLTCINVFRVATRSSAGFAIALHGVAINVENAAGTMLAEIASAVRGMHGQFLYSLHIELQFEQ